ncbi:MAG: MBL fold metallo-hydrolase [Clostridia bacterium]|nr:MBL fold metallo-hydrolase [Clostridia bacterium]
MAKKERKKNKKQLFIRLCILAAAIVLAAGAVYAYCNRLRGDILEVCFIDVGQGDSAVCFFPDGTVVLIDAGEVHMGPRVCEFLRGRGVARIDYAVATHPHTDHIGGMAEVLDNFEVGELWLPDCVNYVPAYGMMMSAAYRKGITVRTAEAGAEMIEGSAVFLAPQRGAEYSEMNDMSAVLHVTYGKRSFLFMGDAEACTEYDIAVTDCDVLKLGHHGSSTSGSPYFLRKVKPEIVIISSGEDNPYGHPHIETKYDLTMSGACVYNTAHYGTVSVKTDGERVKVGY